MLTLPLLCTALAIASLAMTVVAGMKAKGSLTIKNWPGRLVIIGVVVFMLAIVGCVFTWSEYADQRTKEELLTTTIAQALGGTPESVNVKLIEDRATGTATKAGVTYEIDAQFTMRRTSTKQGWMCEVRATPVH